MHPGASETTENAGQERAFILYNPRAGGQGTMFEEANLLPALQQRFVECVLEPTTGPGSATGQVRQAIAAGFTHIIVCGGDGTLMEALQAVVGTNAALGVLPMGTGNVVARDLGLSTNLAQAARQLLGFRARTVPVGVVESLAGAGYFLASAGVGVHAKLMRVPKVAGAGRLQYYANGLRMLATAARTPFAVRLTGPSGATSEFTCNELLVTRVRSYGGVLQRWQPGCGLTDEALAVTVAQTKSLVRTLAFVGSAVTGIATDTEYIRTMPASRVECARLTDDVPTQVDGTALDGLPVAFGTRPNAVRLLMPTS